MDYRQEHALMCSPGLPARLYHPDGKSVTGHLYIDGTNLIYNTGLRTVQLTGLSIQQAMRVTGYLDTRQNVFNVVLRDFLQLQFQILVEVDIEWVVNRIDKLGLACEPPRKEVPMNGGTRTATERTAKEGILVSELKRMGVNIEAGPLRVSNVNRRFSVCPSYPEDLIVPTICSDELIKEVILFRRHGRLPIPCYRHRKTGALIVRASQPLVGCGSKRKRDHRDEYYVQAMCMPGFTAEYTDLPEEFTDVTEQDPYIYGVSDSLGGGMTNSLSSTATGFMAAAASSFSMAISNFASSSSMGGPTPRMDSPTGADSPHPSRGRSPMGGTSVQYYVLDTRSAKAARNASLTTGGGVGEEEWYEESALMHLNMGTSVDILDSYEKLRAVCSDGSQSASNWMYKLESSGWMGHVQSALQGAVFLAKNIDSEGKSCLVQDCDGWGSVGVVVSLAQVILDSFYRTIEGLRILIQKEWISAGYPFYFIMRNHGSSNKQSDGPMFLMFIDCLSQMVRQRPSRFQYTDLLLRTLVLHVVCSPHPHGPFSYDNEQERRNAKYADEMTSDSFWAEVGLGEDHFSNPLFRPIAGVHTPSTGAQSLEFWSALYSRWADASRESYMACAEIYPHRKESNSEKTEIAVLRRTRKLVCRREEDWASLYKLEKETIERLTALDEQLGAEVSKIFACAPFGPTQTELPVAPKTSLVGTGNKLINRNNEVVKQVDHADRGDLMERSNGMENINLLSKTSVEAMHYALHNFAPEKMSAPLVRAGKAKVDNVFEPRSSSFSPVLPPSVLKDTIVAPAISKQTKPPDVACTCHSPLCICDVNYVGQK